MTRCNCALGVVANNGLADCQHLLIAITAGDHRLPGVIPASRTSAATSANGWWRSQALLIGGLVLFGHGSRFPRPGRYQLSRCWLAACSSGAVVSQRRFRDACRRCSHRAPQTRGAWQAGVSWGAGRLA